MNPTKEDVRAIQEILSFIGADPGPVDGIWGEQTRRGTLEALRMARGVGAHAPDMGHDAARAIAMGIVEREGGFVNDPDDPGGATKFGVTIGTMKRLGIDIDGDGDVDVDDVRSLTVEEAAEIFLKHYYDEPRIADLPEPLRDTVFDMQVNAGDNAVRILQKMLGDLLKRSIVADGKIGPKTLSAAHEAAERFPDIRDRYGAARREYYFTIADRRPASRKYAVRQDGGKGGWITRAEEFMSSSSHMTSAQFRERIRRWA